MSDKRDHTLEQALKHELRGASSTPGADPALRRFSEGECLDAEILAAWADGGLDASQAAMTEAHVSSCARCQSLVGTFVRGTPAPTLAPGTEAPRTWVFWKWLAPLAAGAAAVTLWMVVPEQREVALEPPQPPASMAAIESPKLQTQPEAPPPAVVPAPAQEARDAARPAESRQNTIASERVRQRKDAPVAKTQEARKEAAPAALAETITVQDASPAATAPAPAPPAPAAARLGRTAQFALMPIEIISPEAARRWRITEAGIERSLDAGGNWSLVRAAAGERITAGTSPSPAVCWLIGDNGVVLLTTDGLVFFRVDIPDAGNLRSITATNGTAATVVNAAGRTFRTDDGGRTWR